MRFSPLQFSHTEKVLSELLCFAAPADATLSKYFRQEKKLGQNDRAFIAELVYCVLRHKRSLEARCGERASFKRLLLAALSCEYGLNRKELAAVLNEADEKWLAQVKSVNLDDFPPAVKLDLPDWFFEYLSKQYDVETITKLAKSLNEPAPLDLRSNPLKMKRDDALVSLIASGIPAEAAPYSPFGIRLGNKPSLSKNALFVNGAIEVQDEGSQLLCMLMQAKRGEMVADFCAGAGGKTLLLGAMMNSQGSLYAMDVSEKRLAKMKPRLARSGLSNVHPICLDSENDSRVKRLSGKFDRVLVDAPCSGLGTLRRNPDLKWRQSEESVKELTDKQAKILKAASALVKKGGRLVYATCSLLADENENLVSHFLNENPGFKLVSALDILNKQGVNVIAPQDEKYFKLLPHIHNTDGFFAAVMERI